MKNIYIAKINNETNIIEGFYIESIHGKEVCDQIIRDGGITLSEELWQELLSMGQAQVDLEKLSSVPVKLDEHGEISCFDIDCKECFIEVKPEPVEQEYVPTKVDLLEEKVNSLDEKMDRIVSQLSQLLESK